MVDRLEGEVSMSAPATPLYLDWQFWSAIVALVALALTQFPPIRLWFRRSRLDIEVQSRVKITHKVGNPNLGMYVSIQNPGGRELRVRKVSVAVTRDGRPIGSYPAVSYFEGPNSNFPALFVPFVIRPNEMWAHNTIFLQFFDRSTEKLYRENQSALRKDIGRKFDERAQDNKELVVGDDRIVNQLLSLFDRLFIWLPGEYGLDLKVVIDSGKEFSRHYRFTLFESDCDELRSYKDDYKHGGGIWFDVERHMQLDVPLSSDEN